MDRRRVLLVAAAIVAALGTVLVFVYVQGADSRAQDKYKTVQVLVATGQISTGESIAAAAANGKIASQSVSEASLLPGAATGTQGIENLVALTYIYPGEQIIPQKLGTDAAVTSSLPIPAGKIAISINLSDPARVAGFIRPGAQVAIIYSGDNPTSGQQLVRTLLPKVTVLGVGSATPAPVDATAAQAPAESVANTLLTLALTQDDAQRVLFAQNQGSLTFALLTQDAKVKAGLTVDSSNLFGKR